jgi:predicted metal-dependent phosphoesterase TrpH
MLDYLKVEFHCHSQYSIDCLSTPQKLIDTARKKGIDRLIITDHSSIQGALAAKKLAPELIIIGEEVRCKEGELLATYVMEEIPWMLPLEEAIARLKEQGAFISVAHPFDSARGWKLNELEKVIPHVDAVEGFNARCLFQKFNQEAIDYADKTDLPITVGSDAHSYWELGRSTMMVPSFSNAQELRNNIRDAVPSTMASPFWVRGISRGAMLSRELNLISMPKEEN